MSLKIMSQVWEHPNLSAASEKLVLLCLADFANDEGVCWPKMATVAAKCNLTERGARGIIENLETRCFLTRDVRPGKARSNVYLMHVERGVKAPKKAPKPELGNRNTVPVLESKTGTETLKPEPISGYPVPALYKGEPSCTMNEPSEEEETASSSSPECDDFSDARNRASPPPQKSPPVPPESSRAPFIEGAVDPRFETPHFRGTCHACGYDPDDLTLQKRAKILIAAQRLTKYTPEQIAEAAAAWPHASPPHPNQFADEFKRLLSRKEPRHDNRNQSNSSAARQAALAELQRDFSGVVGDCGEAGRGLSAVGIPEDGRLGHQDDGAFVVAASFDDSN